MFSPQLPQEVVGLVIDNVDSVPDLLNCACVNSIWNSEALKKLYEGSIHDMRFRTPDIGSLNCLFVASRKRFWRNMSFVKHLLISPASHTVYYAHLPKSGHFENCRALRHPQDTENLLQPPGKGLTSFAIPFDIARPYTSDVEHLFLPPTVEFLAIAAVFCEDFLRNQHRAKLGNLKALTIYEQNGEDDSVDAISEFLEACDLQFFNLETTFLGRRGFDIERILPYLQQQRNLMALALNMPFLGGSLISESSTLTQEGLRNPWPKLKALSLGQGDEQSLELLPTFEDLQILRIHQLSEMLDIGHTLVETIGRCKHLRALNIGFEDIETLAAIPDIVRDCPLLQEFVLMDCIYSVEEYQAEILFSRLIHALPRVEFLRLGLKFQMSNEMLQDLARLCPQLSILCLPSVELSMALAKMTEVNPFQQLESMILLGIFFQNPCRMMHCDRIQSIVTEWRRIFPKLKPVMPCHDDYEAEPWEEVALMGIDLRRDDLEDEVLVRAEKEMKTSIDKDCVGTILRTKLWKALGYRRDWLTPDNIQYIWQTNMEIEMIGWPVVPLKAFSDQSPFSTRAN
ncbi:hypothetical protein P170DRAFT_510410 [Aspergillus steynii IBT 23096]|uniref:F-box domain-containing protein n=1 Tax=Aspergillus steynii IBT 23096 TaxID=1392250 RepID=A0A2I2G411_9EURO|nr:uncharacterized protein P170DRAFT_510410 [Aspergillus steynii IBT 23096]PLB47593.1 hypothetical protein P170DRAFT_510410 [Aspergillus steynii IBT 23096]